MLRNNSCHLNSENNLNSISSNFNTHFFIGEKRPMIIFSCSGMVRKGGIFLRTVENFPSFSEHTVTSCELERSKSHDKAVSTHQLSHTGFHWMPRINTLKAEVRQKKWNKLSPNLSGLHWHTVQWLSKGRCQKNELWKIFVKYLKSSEAQSSNDYCWGQRGLAVRNMSKALEHSTFNQSNIVPVLSDWRKTSPEVQGAELESTENFGLIS